jgi:hypothetical protein
MLPDGIVEAIDMAANGSLGIVPGHEDTPRDDLGFQGFEEGLDHGVIVTVAPAGHRDVDAAPAKLGLLVHGTVLAAAVGVADQAGLRAADGQGLTQDLILPPQPFQLRRRILTRRAPARIFHLPNPSPGQPARQRRQADPKVLANLLLRRPARPQQANRLLLKRLREPLPLYRRKSPSFASGALHFSEASPTSACPRG